MDRAVTVDKTITMAVILTIILQTASALLWVGAAETRLAVLEAHEKDTPMISERLTRLEEQMIMARQSLTRIETRLNTPPK